MIRAAVIGVGAMGKQHARIYNELDRVELAAVADVDEDMARNIARCYKVAWYTDYRAMLDQEKLDVISIAVPTCLHRQVAFDVIDRGVHLLVEKPIAGTVEEAQEIIDRAVERGVKLMVGHVERFNPAILELKRRLDKGELGRVFQMHARRLGPFPERVRDVGVVIDLATHDLDVMRYLTGSEVVRVYAETEQEIHTDHEDLLSGLVKFADGTIGVLNINWLTPTKIRELSVTGERGMFLADYLTQDLYYYENSYNDGGWEMLGILRGVGEGNMIRLRIEKKEPLKAELESFIEAVIDDSEPLVTGADGLKALALAQWMVRSGQTNKAIRLVAK
jgi:predicted dehydrogenase